ncbi:MAG: deaminase [Candidatus Berkiella sp.]
MDNEIVIGLIAPLGCDKEYFLDKIKHEFKSREHAVEVITVTDLIFQRVENKYPKSFTIFAKMEICSLLRKNYKGAVAVLIIEEIIKRGNKNTDKKVVYIIDQLKNESDCKVLSHVYGLNYTQLSLYSNEIQRDRNLSDRIRSDQDTKHTFNPKQNEHLIKSLVVDDFLKKEIIHSIKSIKNYNMYNDYQNQISSDVTHCLIEKDYKETQESHGASGQQFSKIFHKSDYFFNLDVDKSSIAKELEKFVMQLFGEYKDYPTQDEYGMAVAYDTAFRSNFPGERHIGAAIIGLNGEIISTGSIRAPNKSSNTNVMHQDSVASGYDRYKNDIKTWIEWMGNVKLAESDASLKEKNDSCIKNIQNFLNDSIDFHPCTHAEIAALLDAAKAGVSVMNATLYTTTFPCHLCAKDIISAGVSKVVYIEEYPKSKSKTLYPTIIDLNSQNKKDVIPFQLFSGVSPNRYHRVYSLENKPSESDRNQESEIFPSIVSPYLRYENRKYYRLREEDVCRHFSEYLNENKSGNLDYLDNLLKRH